MTEKLFLTGPSGCGKTTLLQTALGNAITVAGGFITYRVTKQDGLLIGYDLAPSAYAGGISGFEPLRFLDYAVTPPKSDNEVFRKDAVKLLNEAVYYPFSVLDEIGGFEILIPEFRAALADFLSSDAPCIGVYKSAPNSETLRQRLGLGEKFLAYRQQLETAIAASSSITLLETSGRYDKRAAEAVDEWCRKYAL